MALSVRIDLVEEEEEAEEEVKEEPHVEEQEDEVRIADKPEHVLDNKSEARDTVDVVEDTTSLEDNIVIGV